MSDRFLPQPPRIAALLAPSSRECVNLSLSFNRGVWYDSPLCDKGSLKKHDFLKSFAERFSSSPAHRRDYAAWIERREETMSRMGASTFPMRADSRLVIGLGLPHPTETSLLLDGITGCPYIPGSTVKGLLRAAAEMVLDGELKGSAFWSREACKRMFGPRSVDQQAKAKGELVVYDAFPASWPLLELDVMTPHYTEYYESARDNPCPPGDWEDPVPVPFLVVRPGTDFLFSFSLLGAEREQDAEAAYSGIKRLLGTALKWLGVGGKKSSGYGSFVPGGTQHR